MEVLDHPFEAVTLDEVIRHEERQLVRGQRALLAVAHREPPRGAERLEVEASGNERCVIANAGPRHRAPPVHRIEAEALEDAEGDPLRHAFGKPLLGETFTLRELDLTDVGHLVGDQAQPLAAGPVGALVVQKELPALADADGEVRQLGGARGRHVGVVDEPALEHAPGVVDVDRDLLGHREMEIAHEDGGDATDGLFVGGHGPGAFRESQHARLDRDRYDEAATTAARYERKNQKNGQAQVSRMKTLSHSDGDSYTNCDEGEEDFTKMFGRSSIVKLTKSWAANESPPVGKFNSRMN